MEEKKLEYKKMEIDEQKKQNLEIQKIRAEIIGLDKQIQFETSKTQHSLESCPKTGKETPMISRMKENENTRSQEMGREEVTKMAREKLLRF